MILLVINLLFLNPKLSVCSLYCMLFLCCRLSAALLRHQYVIFVLQVVGCPVTSPAYTWLCIEPLSRCIAVFQLVLCTVCYICAAGYWLAFTSPAYTWLYLGVLACTDLFSVLYVIFVLQVIGWLLRLQRTRGCI